MFEPPRVGHPGDEADDTLASVSGGVSRAGITIIPSNPSLDRSDRNKVALER